MSFVAGVGRTNIDILYSGLKHLPAEGEEVFSQGFDIQLGGGVPATMVNLHRLGAPTKLCTFLGNDLLSSYAKDRFLKSDIDLVNLYEGDEVPLIVTSIMITKKDRTFASYCSNLEVTKELEDKIYNQLKGAKVVAMQMGYINVYKRLKEEGTILVFDTGWDDTMSLVKYKEYLELADYYTPNQKEAIKITGSKTLEEAAKKLGAYFDKVIIKLDKDGCMCVENDTIYIVPPMKNVTAVDSTGAGDAFLSGFIYGLYHDYNFKDAILFGNITGGTCVQAVGCLTKYVNEQELLDIANRIIEENEIVKIHKG